MSLFDNSAFLDFIFYVLCQSSVTQYLPHLEPTLVTMSRYSRSEMLALEMKKMVIECILVYVSQMSMFLPGNRTSSETQNKYMCQ